MYQLTNNLTHITEGCLLGFTNKHNISSKAKKLQVLLEGIGIKQFDIISIPSEKEVVINAPQIKDNKIFVYGEEADDFRTIDYEGLTTLNISATQQLSKLIKLQQLQIDEQNKKIEALIQTVNLMKAKTQPAIAAK